MDGKRPFAFPVGRRAVLAGLSAGALTGLIPAPLSAAASGTVFGVNCYDLFTRSLSVGRKASDPVARIRDMARQKIPFARFAASPFWPNDWRRVDADRKGALDLLDLIVKTAREEGVRLVPSVIWAPAFLADHLGEHMVAWGDPASRTRRFAADYAADVIGRHIGDNAILAWEFSNEVNDFAGMPGSERWWPQVKPEVGTPAQRTAADRFSWDDIASAYGAFVAQVHKLDPGKPVSTGANIPRPQMMKQIRGEKGSETPNEFAAAFALSLAGGADWLSLHLYMHSAKGHFGKTEPDLEQILSIARSTADRRGAKLFVGEFGVPDAGKPDVEKAQLQQLFDRLIAARVDYAALWAYDLHFMPEFSITGNNARAWQLAMMREANTQKP